MSLFAAATAARGVVSATGRRHLSSARRRCALITGSTSGIGLGIAERLAKSGFNVVMNGFGDAAAIEASRSSLERAHGVTVLCVSPAILFCYISAHVDCANNKFIATSCARVDTAECGPRPPPPPPAPRPAPFTR